MEPTRRDVLKVGAAGALAAVLPGDVPATLFRERRYALDPVENAILTYANQLANSQTQRPGTEVFPPLLIGTNVIWATISAVYVGQAQRDRVKWKPFPEGLCKMVVLSKRWFGQKDRGPLW